MSTGMDMLYYDANAPSGLLFNTQMLECVAHTLTTPIVSFLLLSKWLAHGVLLSTEKRSLALRPDC